eukprot:6621605-Prymnesium_polylepis.1
MPQSSGECHAVDVRVASQQRVPTRSLPPHRFSPARGSRTHRIFQYTHESTSAPIARSSNELHLRNAAVTAHGAPVVSSTSALSTASSTAPAHSGQEPRRPRLAPAADGWLLRGGGLRHRSDPSAASATTRHMSRPTTVPPPAPNSLLREIGSDTRCAPPPDHQNSKLATPPREPHSQPKREMRAESEPDPAS